MIYIVDNTRLIKEKASTIQIATGSTSKYPVIKSTAKQEHAKANIPCSTEIFSHVDRKYPLIMSISK